MPNQLWFPFVINFPDTVAPTDKQTLVPFWCCCSAGDLQLDCNFRPALELLSNPPSDQGATSADKKDHREEEIDHRCHRMMLDLQNFQNLAHSVHKNPCETGFTWNRWDLMSLHMRQWRTTGNEWWLSVQTTSVPCWTCASAPTSTSKMTKRWMYSGQVSG